MQQFFRFRKVHAIECSHGNSQNVTNVSVPQKNETEEKEVSIMRSRKSKLQKLNRQKEIVSKKIEMKRASMQASKFFNTLLLEKK